MTQASPLTFFTRYATAVAILTVTLLALSIAGIFYMQQQAGNTAKGWVVHTYEVTGHIQLLFNRLKDVELGQRGYIISGDEQYLAPYYDAMKDSLGADAQSDRLEQHHSIAEELKILRKLTPDNPRQIQNLDELDEYIKQLLAYWAATIDKRKNDSSPDAKSDFLQEDAQMNHIRSLISIMMAEENHLLSKRIRSDEASTAQSNNFTFSGIALFYILLVAAILLYQKHRKMAREEQEKLVAKLLRSNEELERFAYVASHDMQEPIRTIVSFSKIIAEDFKEKLTPEETTYITLVEEAATRMQAMLSDLLHYARLGSNEPRMVTVNAEIEFHHVMQNLTIMLNESHAIITHDPLPTFKGNPVQFTRLMQNLIANGIKYQAPDNTPKVHISAKEEEGEWHFTIADNGIGIQAEFLNQIFEPFRRLHVWSEYTGSGLGLTISRKIVESHGGRIWVTSAPEKGSIFHFTMPKAQGEAT